MVGNARRALHTTGAGPAGIHAARVFVRGSSFAGVTPGLSASMANTIGDHTILSIPHDTFKEVFNIAGDFA